MQSHLSENGAEMDWVRQHHPDCRQYWETYKKYGLWNDRTVMAHCVWSDERERQAMKDAGVTVVHCADSNQNLCSGVAPVRRMLDEGVKVALGSDIAGGDHLDLFDVTAAAIRASKARRMMDDWSTPSSLWRKGGIWLPLPGRNSLESSRALPREIPFTPSYWRMTRCLSLAP